jgi:hypothetical protein
MVMRRLSSASRLPAASLLTARTSKAAKQAKLPAAARNQKGPELSAREASASPATNSIGLQPVISLSTCLSFEFAHVEMLSPPSDKSGGRKCLRPGGLPWEVTA